MAANNNPTTEVLAGLVERVTFHNEDNGFCVLRVKARGKREPITVVGHAAVISAGEFIQASGDWANDRTHGVQFRARFLKTMPPTTTEGIAFDGRPVAYAFGELDQIVLAYATTIHKSQGSEFPAVVIPITTQHYMMLQRNLLYTGVTRGKRLVILLGQKKAVAIAVKNGSGRRRWSKLREWLNPVGFSIPRLIGA
jgi:UvrD-like helicase C-terminal domain